MTADESVVEGLRRRLLTELSTRTLAPGTRMGSERELAKHYGVSRTTLRQALASLEEAGLISRKIGRHGGTFVNHARIDRDLGNLVGFPVYLAKQGHSTGSRVVSAQMITADEQSQHALRLPVGAPIVEIRRVRLADARPMALDTARFPADLVPGLLEMPLGGSLYQLIEQEYGIYAQEAEESIEMVHATADEASFLAVNSGDPLWFLTRTTFAAKDGRPFEYSHDLYRADRTRITARIPGRGMSSPSTGANHYIKLSTGA